MLDAFEVKAANGESDQERPGGHASVAMAQRILTIGTKLRGRKWVEVTVADRGNGIASHEWPTYFKPFFSTKPNGMGLGLVICRSIVESHGGELSVSANVSGGATFTCLLPNIATVTPKVQEETVYIVDDEEPLRRSLKYLLESVKLRVEAFESAETLLKSLTPLSHGCIVLDVRMPGMSGPELMDHLIERGFAIPIIFAATSRSSTSRFPCRETRQALVDDSRLCLLLMRPSALRERASHAFEKRLTVRSFCREITNAWRCAYTAHGKAGRQAGLLSPNNRMANPRSIR